ncbi:MAG: arginine--tRNA ligase [Actinobacteria bacterium]|nr:arginine--tRNA ligase [Actinomycetota bacterium]
MTPDQLEVAIIEAVRRAVDAGDLTAPVPDQVQVERPRVREHGDYATNLALRLARPAGRAPRAVAEIVAAQLRDHEAIAKVEVAGPGFLNITLAEGAQGELARTIVAAGRSYGRSRTMAGQRVNLEFVSANPTGPLHLGAVRWAAVGDALARILQAAGADVTREYYFNDAGGQIDRFAASLYAAALGQPAPEDGYAGEYITDIAAAVARQHPGVLDLPAGQALETFRREGVELMFVEIKRSLVDFGVHFDVYFNERELHARGELDDAVARLREQGHVFEADGAVWLRTTDFDDDRDRVLIRSNGVPTYFCADAAYYLDKRRRGFDRVVIMLGADHHGYIGRYRAIAACFGDDPDTNLEILIGQMVNLVRGGEPLRMSKRAGTVVTIEDLVGAVGADAGRYALARSSVDSTIDIDLDLWARHTSDNPVFYVQYAHARLSSLGGNARSLGIELGDPAAADLTLLRHEREGDLLRTLAEFPQVVATAAELRGPHRIARYAEQLAGAYHRFYDDCRVLPLGDEPVTALNVARLWLSEAARTVLANALELLGVTAPERM